MAGTTIERPPIELTPEFLVRFWSKVRIRSINECWPWHIDWQYGGFRVCKGYFIGSHVVAWRIANGGAPVPVGMLVMHDCDFNRCCNPRHLSIGTHSRNLKDCHERTETKIHRGEQTPNAVLNEEIVREIRSLHQPRKFGAKQIAKKLGLKWPTVASVVRGENWKHVT